MAISIAAELYRAKPSSGASAASYILGAHLSSRSVNLIGRISMNLIGCTE